MLDALPDEVLALAVALGAGLLIGVEREQHKADHAGRMAAGVRTLALVSLSGAVAALLGPLAIGVMGAFIALATAVSYFHTHDNDPGLTTEVVIVLTFLIGMLTVQSGVLAGGIAVVVTIVLQMKPVLHRFARQVLTESELNDALLLLASALVILPILPDEPLGPFEGLNLRRLWALVVLVMAINAAGYIAVRAAGPRLGLPLTGLIGGFVSSSATIASMGHRARSEPLLLRAAVAGGMASNLATVALMVAIVAAIDPALLLNLAWPLGLAFVVVCAFVGRTGLHAWRDAVPDGAGMKSRPFHFGHALTFAALIATVLIVSDLLAGWLGDLGVALSAAAVGFADTHAAAVSVAELGAQQRIDADGAVFAILLALSTNTLTKIALARTAGGADYAWRMIPGLVAMLVALWAGWWISRFW
jgi:uncharacterized membrane protein (DUF4010 family)